MANIVYTVLSQTPTVTAIVGTSPCRVFPAGTIPQPSSTDPNAYLPCVTWKGVGGTPENILDGPPPTDHIRLQLDCWATTFDAADALGTAVREALDPYGYCISLNGNDYEPDTKRYRASFDWHFYTGGDLTVVVDGGAPDSAYSSFLDGGTP